MQCELPEMDSVLDTVGRLRSEGFTTDFSASQDARLICAVCASRIDPSTMTVDQVHRFEGMSNPDDEAILFAARASCGHDGIYSAAFGPTTPSTDSAVLQQLQLR